MINVSAKLSNGKIINTPKTFRIKNLPTAAGVIKGDFGVISLPKSFIPKVDIDAEFPDFVFDLQLDVQEFTLKVPGQLSVKVKGNKFNAKAKKAILKARRGDVITIYKIQAIERKSKTRVPRVLPINIEVSN